MSQKVSTPLPVELPATNAINDEITGYSYESAIVVTDDATDANKAKDVAALPQSIATMPYAALQQCWSRRAT